jgi:uncharacterized RDD family membrane protein YckC
MTSVPPGFYPDPAPEQFPGAPALMRWWDGEVWTSRTQLASRFQSPHPLPSQYGAPYPTQYATERDTTPDGQQLAGWWRRGGAYLLDSLISGFISLVVGLPFLKQVYDYFLDLFNDLNRQVEAGVENPVLPTQGAIYSDLWQPFLALAIIGLMVNFFYHCAFLRWKAATPGKLALGIRVRLRDSDGPLTWATILKRWAGQFGVNILGALPIVSIIGSVYQFLDLLWPLWDGKRQALHDKVAATNVVRR